MNALNTINHRYCKVLAFIVLVFTVIWPHFSYACERKIMPLYFYKCDLYVYLKSSYFTLHAFLSTYLFSFFYHTARKNTHVLGLNFAYFCVNLFILKNVERQKGKQYCKIFLHRSLVPWEKENICLSPIVTCPIMHGAIPISQFS